MIITSNQKPNDPLGVRKLHFTGLLDYRRVPTKLKRPTVRSFPVRKTTKVPFKPNLPNVAPRPSAKPTFNSYGGGASFLAVPTTLSKPTLPVPQIKLSVAPKKTFSLPIVASPPKSQSTRQKRRLSDEEDYHPVIKKRRTRRTLPTSTSSCDPTPNFDWRCKEAIQIPDISIITPEEWPPDDPNGFAETSADLTDEAYYVRHFRAEERERQFYHKLSRWREREKHNKEKTNGKLVVLERPIGPWQIKLSNSLSKNIVTPLEILDQPRFNYINQAGCGKWRQPKERITRIVDSRPRRAKTRYS